MQKNVNNLLIRNSSPAFKNKLCCLALLLVLSLNGFAQVTFSGVLLSRSDSSVMAFANIKQLETDKYTATNEKGEFSFSIPETVTVLHLEISSIGCHTTIAYRWKGDAKTARIFVEQLATNISEVEVEGLTARSVVNKAIASIPLNYSDTSYAAYSFYRQYQKVNGVFKNLLEAQPVVMFNLARQGNAILAREAFATEQIRRSNFLYDVKDYYGDELTDLFNQNPVYHLAASALNPKAFGDYYFSFDTLLLPDAYVIDYVCSNYSSDNHGVDNYSQLDFSGESREYGRLVIDKESFAISTYERTAVRNKKYNYPKYNNFIRPSMTYTVEFLEAHLLVEYQPIGGKWYMKKLLHDYTNEFYRTQTYEKAYTITDAYEWYAERITRTIPAALLDKFYFTPRISALAYKYHPLQWPEKTPAFYFYAKEPVYKDLESKSPLHVQFEMNGRK